MRKLPRANYKPACVVYIIIIILIWFLFLFLPFVRLRLSKLTLHLHCLAHDYVAFSSALRIRRVRQRPLNAFINASPWPNSQHLCVAVAVVVVVVVGIVIYMHTSFCIHDVLLPLHSTELT